MDLVLCHTTADFDTLGAAVGMTCLKPGARIVLTGGCHPTVQRFLTLRRNHYRIIDRRAVLPEQIRSITLVDTHHRNRIGPAAEWIDFAIASHLPITIYDHHPISATVSETSIPATEQHIEPVGATTTLVVEALKAQNITIETWEATVMALGIHVDTGSLTYARATPRDAAALAWLMTQGISQQAILEATEPGLSQPLQTLLTEALDKLQTQEIEGYQLGWVYLTTPSFIPGLSSLASHLMTLLGLDGLLLGSEYQTTKGDTKLTLIGRARPRKPPYLLGDGINFQQLLTPLGGGGHPHAASAVVKVSQPDHFQDLFEDLVQQLTHQIPHAPTARDLMSSPVRTIRPETTIGEAQRILLRYGHSGLCVANAEGQLSGVISRRDIDLALHHGFSHAPVKGYMTTNLSTITPKTPLSEIQNLMVTYDIGRLPVLQGSKLQGIVTRTDVLRQVYRDQVHQEQVYQNQGQSQGLPIADLAHAAPVDLTSQSPKTISALGLPPLLPPPPQLYQRLKQCLNDTDLDHAPDQQLWHLLTLMAQEAAQRGWHLYLVGGAVRDLLLTPPGQSALLKDIDLVVDGFHNAADVGAGVELAQVIQQQYPGAELQIHGQFQTAALIFHTDTAQPPLNSAAPAAPLLIDIATARTEFYPYPAANPEVEASSIRQDLYRRDFTINAMAIRLTPPEPGLLIDFFGGWLDLQTNHIRVLHANSFIEDPTRIFRAVRFAVRLGFTIHPQTETFIRYAVESGIYADLQTQIKQTQSRRVPALQTRLKAELKYILETDYWVSALGLLDRLGALSCLHDSLKMTPDLWQQLHRIDRWMRRFALQEKLETWLMLLEVILAQLDDSLRSQVAQSLHLPTHSIERLTTLTTIEKQLLETLISGSNPTQSPRPSHIYQALNPLPLATLLIISSRHPRTLGTQIWQYLTRLATIKPLLNGHDLKRLGYRPGPQFKDILKTLTYATVDGDIRTRSEAQTYLAAHFPIEET